MGTSLTGLTPSTTYDALIKVGDNEPLSATAKYLSDGLGNDAIMSMSTSRVGIGTASPSNLLHLNKASEPELYIQDSVATFRLGINSDNQFFVYTAQAKDIYFSNNNAERLRITSAGNVGIGTSAPTSNLHVNTAATGVGGITLTSAVNTNGAAFLASNGGGGSYFGRNSSTGGAFTGAAYATVVYGGGAYPMSFYTNDTERMRILSDGGLTFNGDTSQANALDDYEEGNWSPNVTFGGLSTGITYGSRGGKYTKIGRQVSVSCYLILSNKGTATGVARIDGLPFQIGSEVGFYGGASFGALQAITYNGVFQGYGEVATTRVTLNDYTEAGVQGDITDADFVNSSQILMQFTYFV